MNIKERILSLQTPNGGWTKESLASLGVPWPPPQGWRKQLEQAEVSEDKDDAPMAGAILIEFDGGARPSNPGNRYGSYSVKRDGNEMLRKTKVEFGWGTNNEAEFLALELALEDTADAIRRDPNCSWLRCFALEILTDSTIVRGRLVGKKRAKIFAKYSESSGRMVAHANKCLETMQQFKSFTVEWQPRAKNVANFGH